MRSARPSTSKRKNVGERQEITALDAQSHRDQVRREHPIAIPERHDLAHERVRVPKPLRRLQRSPQIDALRGRHQLTNAATAIALAEELRAQGYAISRAAIIAGLQTATHPGRLELLPGSPPLLLGDSRPGDRGAHRHRGQKLARPTRASLSAAAVNG